MTNNVEDVESEIMGLWVLIWIPLVIGISLMEGYTFSHGIGYIIIGFPISVMAIIIEYLISEVKNDDSA